jgi:miniconductance mechanosensitive channel
LVGWDHRDYFPPFEINQTEILTFGAVSALIILIFRDIIMGFVASVQVAINDMIRIGD